MQMWMVRLYLAIVADYSLKETKSIKKNKGIIVKYNDVPKMHYSLWSIAHAHQNKHYQKL